MLVGLIGVWISGLALGALVVCVLLGVIAAERLAAARRDRRGEAAPLERLEASARKEEV